MLLVALFSDVICAAAAAAAAGKVFLTLSTR